MQMAWTQTVNIAGMPQGSFRSIAGYASESLVVGRAMNCGYIIFVKAWRDSKYDAVLDVKVELYRIEIKGTGAGLSFSTTSGERSGKQIIKGKGTSRKKPLDTVDCDWLICTTSSDSNCWVIPIEYIEILKLENIAIKNIDFFKEKWSIFTSNDTNIKSYLKNGYRKSSTTNLEYIATQMSIDIKSLDLNWTFDESNKRLRKVSLNYHDRIVIAIWENIFKNLIV
jgi:hypothetical protein